MADTAIDYYEILDVPKNADIATIRNAFKKKSKLYHPDRNRDKTVKERIELQEEFVLISRAFDVLSDSQKRQEYDRSQSALFFELRDSSRNAASSFEVRKTIDLDPNDPDFREKFNAEFLKHKAPEPGDSGAGEYGKELAPRRSIKDGMRYTQLDIKKPDRIFSESEKFDTEKFHKMFEYFHGDNAWGGTSIMKASLDEPEPINGDLVEGADIGTSVASYGGLLIVDQERASYDSVGQADYRGSFGAHNPTREALKDIDFQKIERRKDTRMDEEETKRRMSELLSARSNGIHIGERPASFNPGLIQAEAEKKILEDQEKNREFVERYKGQFGGYLD